MQAPLEYRRKLPHIQPEHGVYFVTLRLKDSLPKEITDKLHKKYFDNQNYLLKSSNERKQFDKLYFDEIEDILDSSVFGPTWLKNENVAEIISNNLFFLDGKYFKLICFCIMSNHVHFIVYKLISPLYKILNSFKSFTAREANKILNRSGRFWQREYFDRLVRDRNDLGEKIKYTLNNPVNAGLVGNWKDWRFSYCKPEFI